MRGRIDEFSLVALVKMLAGIGERSELRLRRGAFACFVLFLVRAGSGGGIAPLMVGLLLLVVAADLSARVRFVLYALLIGWWLGS